MQGPCRGVRKQALNKKFSSAAVQGFLTKTDLREAVRDIPSWPCTRVLHAMRPENELKDLPSRSTSGPIKESH